MLEDHQRLMNLFSVTGEIIGRKKLQKMVYIMKKLGFPFQEKFEFHFFGPYSEELTLRIEELCNFGFLLETKEDKGNYYQYKYEITDSGKEFSASSDVEIPNLRDCFLHLNEKSSRFLELVSTILYFHHLPYEEVVEKIQVIKRKQAYTEKEIDEAYQFIDELTKTFGINE